MNEQRLEELTVALNRQLYAESIGLPCDEQELERLTVELEAEYRQAVTNPASQDMALDGLADMLFHELGHAVHFAGIDPTLPFADRYWMHAGTHETVAALFESLLGLPKFLSETMWLNERQVRQLVAFDRFKNLLTGTWLAAEGLTICDAWMEHLTWTQIEQRYAQYCEQFTGIAMPPGFARLDLYVSRVDSYVLGYIMAAARVAHWLEELEANWGVRWWADERAGQAIRERIRLGGAVKFKAEWLDAGAFVRRWTLPMNEEK